MPHLKSQIIYYLYTCIRLRIFKSCEHRLPTVSSDRIICGEFRLTTAAAHDMSARVQC